MDIDLIAKYTGLALEDIKELIYEEKMMKEGMKKAKIEVAKKLLKRNISVEVISDATDLSPEDISKLNMESNV
jgi:predicted transposase YdaD